MPRRQPIRIEQYLKVQEAHLGQFMASGFVVEDALVWRSMPSFMLHRGALGCRGRIVVEVSKALRVTEVESVTFVQTVQYRYNISVQGSGCVFRYDNSHRYDGHPDAFHKHTYVWPEDRQAGPPAWVSQEDWPTLGEVVAEAERWYWAYLDVLDDPDGAPDLSEIRAQVGLR